MLGLIKEEQRHQCSLDEWWWNCGMGDEVQKFIDHAETSRPFWDLAFTDKIYMVDLNMTF